jgi:hypothetical protein
MLQWPATVSHISSGACAKAHTIEHSRTLLSSILSRWQYSRQTCGHAAVVRYCRRVAVVELFLKSFARHCVVLHTNVCFSSMPRWRDLLPFCKPPHMHRLCMPRLCAAFGGVWGSSLPHSHLSLSANLSQRSSRTSAVVPD